MSKVSIAIIFGGVLLALWFVTAFPKAEGQTAANTKDAWMYEQWTGDSAPYTSARLKIATQIRTSSDPDAALEQYESAAASHPRDPFAAFCVAVAAEAKRYRDTTESEDVKCLSIGGNALSSAASPKTYEYARIRFIYSAVTRNPGQDLRQLADRLLRVNPKDPTVLITAARCYEYSDMARALVLGKEASILSPTNWIIYANISQMYYDCYLERRDPRDAEMAGIECRKALEFIPKSNYCYARLVRLSADFSNIKN